MEVKDCMERKVKTCRKEKQGEKDRGGVGGECRRSRRGVQEEKEEESYGRELKKEKIR